MNDYYFDVCSLPLDDGLPFPNFYVTTCSGVPIAYFSEYDDAVDLICLIEEFCESRNLKRKEYETEHGEIILNEKE